MPARAMVGDGAGSAVAMNPWPFLTGVRVGGGLIFCHTIERRPGLYGEAKNLAEDALVTLPPLTHDTPSPLPPPPPKSPLSQRCLTSRVMNRREMGRARTEQTLCRATRPCDRTAKSGGDQ